MNFSKLKEKLVKWNSVLFKNFFSWLHGFHSFYVIWISCHLGHLLFLLWKTILNWSRGWEKHPASSEKRPGGLEKELVVPLFLAGWRGTVHVTVVLLSAGAMRLPLLFHTSAIADTHLRVQRATVSVLEQKCFSELRLQNKGTQRICVFSNFVAIIFFLVP